MGKETRIGMERIAGENMSKSVKEKLDSVMRSELSGEKYIGLQSVTEGGD